MVRAWTGSSNRSSYARKVDQASTSLLIAAGCDPATPLNEAGLIEIGTHRILACAPRIDDLSDQRIEGALDALVGFVVHALLGAVAGSLPSVKADNLIPTSGLLRVTTFFLKN
jgi:hypothetical protein